MILRFTARLLVYGKREETPPIFFWLFLIFNFFRIFLEIWVKEILFFIILGSFWKQGNRGHFFSLN